MESFIPCNLLLQIGQLHRRESKKTFSTTIFQVCEVPGAQQSEPVINDYFWIIVNQLTLRPEVSQLLSNEI